MNYVENFWQSWICLKNQFWLSSDVVKKLFHFPVELNLDFHIDKSFMWYMFAQIFNHHFINHFELFSVKIGQKLISLRKKQKGQSFWRCTVYIKSIFKVGTKMANKDRQNFFFDPPKNKKPSVQKVPPYEIYGDI